MIKMAMELSEKELPVSEYDIKWNLDHDIY
jgi:hypothetical protein